MIESNGTYIYSIDAIKSMASKGFTDDFISKLLDMPEYLREMVMGWTTEDIAESIRAYKMGLNNTTADTADLIRSADESVDNDYEIDLIIEESFADDTNKSVDIDEVEHEVLGQQNFVLVDGPTETAGNGLGYYNGINPFASIEDTRRIRNGGNAQNRFENNQRKELP